MRHSSIVVCLVCLAGCQKKETAIAPVTGTVMFEGKPAEGYIVVFSSQAEETKGQNAHGDVKADGTFQMKSRIDGVEKDGAVVGPHNVAIVQPPINVGPKDVLPVPFRYADSKKSGLTFEVKPGVENKYPITLTP